MDTQSRYPKAIRKALHACAAAAIAALSALSSPIAQADDTDVFLGRAQVSDANVRPNILFIIDTSGSMDTKDIADAPNKSRLDVMKTALVNLLNSVNNVNVGLMTFNSEGGPVRYPIGFIDASADLIEAGGFNVNRYVTQSSDDAEENVNTLINPGLVKVNDPYLHVTESIGSASPTTVTVSVAADSDDVEEYLPTGAMTSTNSTTTNNATSLDAYTSNLIGMRFKSVNIPAGASIISAHLTMTIDPDGSNSSYGADDEYSSTNLEILGEAANSSSSFASGNYTLTTRSKTLASQPWINVPAAEANQTVTSPNLSLIIQEIVNRSGWASGNNITLFLKTTSGFRDFESYHDSSSKAPKLQISYTMDTTRIQKSIGLRFTDVRIPQGAQIRRAYLDFTAAATSSESSRFVIRGESVADSATFTATDKNISSRPVTSNGVVWTLDSTDTWLANQRYATPDITDVIQEIVNRSDWCGGQNMSLIIEPASSSTRLIKSIDGANAFVDAPGLRIEFDTDTKNISSPNTGCIINEVTARVSSSNDDAEERVSNNTTTTTSNSLELIRESKNNQYVGVRFNSLPIPQGAKILNAHVDFTADDTSSGSDTVIIRGHKVADSPAFSAGNGNKNISNRINNASTTASVSWTPADWNTDNQVISTPDIGAIIQEIVNQAGWVSGNNLSILISGSSSETRVAASFDGNAAQAPRLVVSLKQNLAGIPSVSTQTVRQRLVQEVQDLKTVSGTPTVNVFMEAIRYFRGMPVYWGNLRGGQTYNDRYGRVSHAASYQGGVLVQPSGCSNINLNDSDCVYEIVKNGPVYKSPILDPCQSNYIVVLSDGFQNGYYSGDGILSLLASSPDSKLRTCDPNILGGDGADCALKLAEYAHRFDQRTDMEGEQTIKTFSIGFTISTQFLQKLGPSGGGEYKVASSSAELVAAFETFLGNILSQPTTFTAPTLTISAFNRLFNSNEIYISLFEPERSASWSGNIKKYFLCTPEQGSQPDATCFTGQLLDSQGKAAADNGQIASNAVSAWDDIEDGPQIKVGGAGAQVPDYSTRRVYTHTGTSSNLADASNLLTTGNTAVTATMLGAGSSTERNTLIQWIRGQDVDDEDADGGTTDQRWPFGDPLHSAAVTVNYGISSSKKPITKLFVGTNDGGLRMINTSNGKEEWMFIPQELLGMQKELHDNPNGDHFYGMDGSPVAWVNDDNGDSKIDPSIGDFVKIIIGQRRGGQNYYALNVTPSSELTDPAATGGVTPKLLWKINNSTAGYSRLAQTWSKPYISSILMTNGAKTFRNNVIIFGGGYDPINDSAFGTTNQLGNAIYIADAETGSVIWSASGTAGGGVTTVTGMNYSIPSDVRLLDLDGDGAVDRLYVGDMGGQMWRVDLTGPVEAGSKTNIEVGMLATLSNTSTTTPVLADQRRIMFRPDVALVSDKTYAAGTYVAVAFNTGNREDPLSEDVHDRMYVLRDYFLGRMSAGRVDRADDKNIIAFKTITQNDLVDVTDNITSANSSLNATSNDSGWYIDFREPGPKFVGEKGITEGKILISSEPEVSPMFTFNTYIPGLKTDASSCSVTLGTNRTYFVNLLNGTGTDVTDLGRYKTNESYGIASDIIVMQQRGQSDVSVGGGTTDPTNVDLGDTLLPVYILE
ncbi:MAG TPA: PilC/PilY family type IV pilus protein [Gammaproteobacteria bacterium]|nr:PilC/PilY family type IV pilus protein [Gammaproteobacteria bacterium]